MRRTHAERTCPICKVPQRIPEGGLCLGCDERIADLLRFGPMVEQLAARETSSVYIGERCYVPKETRYLSEPPGSDADTGPPAAVWFGTAMRNLLIALCPNKPADKVPNYPNTLFHDNGGPGRYLSYKRDSWAAKNQHIVELSQDARKALHDLYDAFNALLADSYREGQERGQSLIQQLAAGEVTSSSFDQHLDDIARNRQREEEQADRRTERSVMQD